MSFRQLMSKHNLLGGRYSVPPTCPPSPPPTASARTTPSPDVCREFWRGGSTRYKKPAEKREYSWRCLWNGGFNWGWWRRRDGGVKLTISNWQQLIVLTKNAQFGIENKQCDINTFWVACWYSCLHWGRTLETNVAMFFVLWIHMCVLNLKKSHTEDT